MTDGDSAGSSPVLMRIHVGTVDRHEGQPVFRAMVHLLRARGLAGVTVLPTILAFGSRREMHSMLNEITSMDMPVVIECVDTSARIGAVLSELGAMMTGGLVTFGYPVAIRHYPVTGRHRPSSTSRDGYVRAAMMQTVPQSEVTRMRGIAGERIRMRIHVGESDRYGDLPLHEAIVRLLYRSHYAGATVIRGVMGFGTHATVHENHLFHISDDLPVVVECVETEERIDAIIPQLDTMIGGGLMTLERVRAILYRPGAPGSDADDVGPER